MLSSNSKRSLITWHFAGTILKTLPRIFLGYGKLLVTIVHTDSYVIASENYKNLNDQLKNGCLLVQGYGIRNPAEIRYEAFPFDLNDSITGKWARHRAIQKLSETLDLQHTCGYVTFINTGVPDIGCENYEINVHLTRPKQRKDRKDSATALLSLNLNESKMPGHCVAITANANSAAEPPSIDNIPSTIMTPNESHIPDLYSPMDGSEIISFNATAFTATENESDSAIKSVAAASSQALKLKSPVENYFAVTPVNASPSNVFRSDDCNELLAKELAGLDENSSDQDEGKFCFSL